MIDGLRHDQAGRAAERRYKDLARAWRRRMFGRRFAVYFWAIFLLLLVLVTVWHPGARISLFAGFFFGAAAASWTLMPDALMPDHISRWQRGAWGEKNTASELKKLKREGWVVRHDVAWGERGNHDHVAAAGAVFVLNSKNVKDSKVTIEGTVLRVDHLDGDDGYIADRWVPRVAAEAWGVKKELEGMLPFPVHVYPVLVIWGQFDDAEAHLGEVAVVRGDRIAGWLTSRPSDLLKPERRAQVAEAVRTLPRA